MTAEIADLLNGKRASLMFPAVDAETTIGKFVAGHVISVSRRSAPDVHLEQLEGVDEVWAMCFRAPRPGWRVLGRFIERDVFVGYEAYDRHALGTRSNYTAIAERMATAWDRDVGVAPVRSSDIAAYLSGSLYWLVDEEEDDV